MKNRFVDVDTATYEISDFVILFCGTLIVICILIVLIRIVLYAIYWFFGVLYAILGFGFSSVFVSVALAFFLFYVFFEGRPTSVVYVYFVVILTLTITVALVSVSVKSIYGDETGNVVWKKRIVRFENTRIINTV